MEYIKKKIKQLTKIERVGKENNIVPDLSVNYFIKLSLTSEMCDMGVFDSDLSNYVPDNTIIITPPPEN